MIVTDAPWALGIHPRSCLNQRYKHFPPSPPGPPAHMVTDVLVTQFDAVVWQGW